MPITTSENTLRILPSRRIAAVLMLPFTAVFIVLVFQADRGALPRWLAAIHTFPGGDKLGHFLIAGLLSLTLNLAIPERLVRFGRYSVYLGSLLVFITLAAEEFTQLFIQTRTFSWLDLSSDLLGILAASYLVWRLARLGGSAASQRR